MHFKIFPKMPDVLTGSVNFVAAKYRRCAAFDDYLIGDCFSSERFYVIWKDCFSMQEKERKKLKKDVFPLHDKKTYFFKNRTKVIKGSNVSCLTRLQEKLNIL